jgi:hypothetical protein
MGAIDSERTGQQVAVVLSVVVDGKQIASSLADSPLSITLDRCELIEVEKSKPSP